MNQRGDFAQSEAMGGLLFHHIQVPPANLNDRLLHPALFQLPDHLLFKLAGHLACPGALFEEIRRELVVVKIAPYIVSKLSGVGHFPVWKELLNGVDLNSGNYCTAIINKPGF